MFTFNDLRFSQEKLIVHRKKLMTYGYPLIDSSCMFSCKNIIIGNNVVIQYHGDGYLCECYLKKPIHLIVRDDEYDSVAILQQLGVMNKFTSARNKGVLDFRNMFIIPKIAPVGSIYPLENIYNYIHHFRIACTTRRKYKGNANIAISSITPSRKIGKYTKDDLYKEMVCCGISNPISIKEDGTIVDGNIRYYAAKERGDKRMEVNYV